MSDVVFVLGAGASKQAGAPLMADFLDVAGDLLLSGKAEDKRDDFEQVFRAIGGMQAVHSKAQLDLTNIESVFTALELGKIIQTVPGLTADKIPATIAALKRLIVKTLEATIRLPAKDRGLFDAPPPYGHFANLLKGISSGSFPPRSVSVITFNYDLALDIALHQADLGPDYALYPSIDPTPHIQLMKPHIQVMKLHGSLNWVTEAQEGKKIRAVELNRLEQPIRTLYANQISNPETRELAISFSRAVQWYFEKMEPLTIEQEPVIVPPSWNKTDYHQALSDVWARAAKHLSEAQYIFVIGYSLPPTDSFFRHLYALGSVGEAPLRKFAVYDPASKGGGVDSRFRELLGTGAVSRYAYMDTTFEHAIDHIRDLFKVRP
jgi:hypothetical protein